MNLREIRSSSNPFLREYRRLAGSRRHRRATGKLALEGPRLLQEALAAGLRPAMVFATRHFLEEGGEELCLSLPGETRRYLLSSSLFNRLAHTETPQGIAAVVPFAEPDPAVTAAAPLSLVIILDRVRDPGNMGTIVRTAAAVGAEAIFCGPGCVDPYSPKVLRASAGAVFHSPPAAVGDLRPLVQRLQRRGLTVVATQPQADSSFWGIDYRRPTAILVGSEGSGLSPELIAAADVPVCIPQLSAPRSLNAAVATAVILYEALRQRTGG